MTPDEVKAIVQDEILKASHSGDLIANPHGVDLKRCLLATPERRTYVDNDQPVDMWLVLEEDPDSHAGYEIVFDETSQTFGLATPGFDKIRFVFIGYYGSFLDTLKGM